MKTTQKLFVPLLTLAAFTVLSQTAAPAQTNSAATTAPPPATTPESSTDDDSRFKKGEWDISAFGAYVDQAGGKWGAGAALTYFLTEKIGVGGATYWTSTGGTFFDNAEAEGYFRLPLFKRLAPYAVAGIGYQFDRKYWFETAGAGLDFRAFKRLQAFSDIQYRFSNDDSKSGGGVFLRLGARFTF